MRDEKEEIGEMGEGRSKREGKEARGKGDLGRKMERQRDLFD